MTVHLTLCRFPTTARNQLLKKQSKKVKKKQAKKFNQRRKRGRIKKVDGDEKLEWRRVYFRVWQCRIIAV